jgi:pentatricopeptide repeat protein
MYSTQGALYLPASAGQSHALYVEDLASSMRQMSMMNNYPHRVPSDQDFLQSSPVGSTSSSPYDESSRIPASSVPAGPRLQYAPEQLNMGSQRYEVGNNMGYGFMHGMQGAKGRGRGGEPSFRNGMEHRRGQGYRKLWQAVTKVGKGQRLGENDAMPFSDMTVEDMLRIIRSLPPGTSAVKAISQGLYYLDSRALAALLKDLAKTGSSHIAFEIFDWLRSLEETHELAALCDVYTYTTMISQCGSHHQLRVALELVAEMRGREIPCNVHTYRCALCRPATGSSLLPHVSDYCGPPACISLSLLCHAALGCGWMCMGPNHICAPFTAAGGRPQCPAGRSSCNYAQGTGGARPERSATRPCQLPRVLEHLPGCCMPPP